MPLNDDFIADPLGFMEDNLVFIMINDPTPGVKQMTLKSSNAMQFRRYQGNNALAAPAVELELAAHGAPSFPAYWLPYAADTQFHMELRNAAKLMFTPRMDGCTFASSCAKFDRPGHAVWRFIKGKTKSGALVSHTNMQHQGLIDQPLMNHMVRMRHGGGAKSLKKSDYNTSNSQYHDPNEHIMLTTFGLRRGGKWRFYYQQYEMWGMGEYRLLDVKKAHSA